jgi:hypothetical protein
MGAAEIGPGASIPLPGDDDPSGLPTGSGAVTPSAGDDSGVMVIALLDLSSLPSLLGESVDEACSTDDPTSATASVIGCGRHSDGMPISKTHLALRR